MQLGWGKHEKGMSSSESEAESILFWADSQKQAFRRGSALGQAEVQKAGVWRMRIS